MCLCVCVCGFGYPKEQPSKKKGFSSPFSTPPNGGTSRLFCSNAQDTHDKHSRELAEARTAHGRVSSDAQALKEPFGARAERAKRRAV